MTIFSKTIILETVLYICSWKKCLWHIDFIYIAFVNFNFAILLLEFKGKQIDMNNLFE